MKFSININQKAIIDLKLKNFDIIDAVILDFLKSFCAADDKTIKQITLQENGIMFRYTWVNYSYLLQELPLLKLNQTQSISNRMKKLTSYDLIKLFKDPNNNVYVRLTEKIKLLDFDLTPSIYIDTPSIEIDDPINLDLDPHQSRLMYHNIKDHNITDHKEIRNLTTQNTIEEEKISPENNSKVISVFEEYLGKINKNARLTLKGAEKIETRLKTFSVPELKIAIQKFASDEWWMANNAHQGVVWFFGGDEKIDRFLNLGTNRTKKDQVIKIN